MLDIKYLILLLVISLIFIIYTNYQCVKIGSKIETLQIELDQNIEGRMLEGFANLPEITSLMIPVFLLLKIILLK